MKEEKYKLLVEQVRALSEGEHDAIPVLANAAAAMKSTFPEEYFWVGFYLVKPVHGGEGEELLLGPFQGTVACVHIKKGKGVCGAAWQQQQSIIVDDVEQFPGHIACSSLSRSEIVVPIMKGDRMVAEIDIDSTETGTFDDTDRRYLEEIANILSQFIG